MAQLHRILLTGMCAKVYRYRIIISVMIVFHAIDCISSYQKVNMDGAIEWMEGAFQWKEHFGGGGVLVERVSWCRRCVGRGGVLVLVEGAFWWSERFNGWRGRFGGGVLV